MDPDGLAFQDLYVGKEFKTSEEVEQFVKNLGARHRSPFKGDDKSNGRIQYNCPHAVNRDTRSKGDRKLQRILYSKCPAMINVVQNRHGQGDRYVRNLLTGYLARIYPIYFR
jgi:hypothetical protein